AAPPLNFPTTTLHPLIRLSTLNLQPLHQLTGSQPSTLNPQPIWEAFAFNCASLYNHADFMSSGARPKQFHKLLAANRSEIAIRIFRAATELGLRTVAVYAQEDRLSVHRFKP